ncbi:MAG TPA: DUF58 domain-containing protein [Anaerolineae bacterium]|nr:DUF58 domain-containing protein [Anaerolineae bacterium]HMR66147.1 DUF58 domain-containing protein [Anaerolineae bacterium]
MWFRNIFASQSKSAPLPLFDEAFVRRLERLSFRTLPRLRGTIPGERRSRNLRPALDFSDHRPYTHGDDLRHVDWNAYGRQEDLFVKLGEASQSVTIHILLDRSRSMHWDAAASLAEELPRRTLKWDAARRLAGALSYLALTGGERLVLTPFAQQLDPGLGPTQGKRQIVPTLRFLSDLTPSGSFKEGEAGLIYNLKRYADTHPRGGLLIIISDLLNAAVSIETGAAAAHLAEGLRFLPGPTWQVIVMHLLTAQELDPAPAGDVDLRDLETGDRAPFRLDEPTLTQYRLRVKRWCSELQQASSRRGAVYARLLADWPFEQTVVPYLRQRGVF